MHNVQLLSAALLSGCLTSTVNELREDVALDGEITDVVVSVPSGDLTIEVAATAEPELLRVVRWTGSDPAAAAWVEGTVLHIDVDCGSQVTCQADHVLRLPGPATLAAELGSGDVAVRGLAGRVDVRTGSGEVSLVSVEGTIVASSGDGRVAVEDVEGTLSIDTGTGELIAIRADVSEVLATSGAGNVELDLISNPERVTVDSGSGDLWVSVPVGTYRIDAATGSGKVSISGLTADASADRGIDLETGRGDIVIEGRAD